MIIQLPWPPSVNHYWRSIPGRKHPIISEEGRDYRYKVERLLRDHGVPPITDALRVSIAAFPPDRRRRDLDNFHKAPLDALTHAGIYKDDSQIGALASARMPVQADGELALEIATLKPGRWVWVED